MRFHIRVNDSFERGEFKAMVKEIMNNPRYKDRTVLICWEHAVIPSIAAEFGVANAPKEWDKKIFDRVWIISFANAERPRSRTCRST